MQIENEEENEIPMKSLFLKGTSQQFDANDESGY